MFRYEMKSDLKKQLIGKSKKEVIEMIGDSTLTINKDWGKEWRIGLGSDGSYIYDYLFMIIFFEDGKVKKVTFEGV